MPETIYRAGKRQVEYQRIAEPHDLVIPFEETFPVLVWNCLADYPVAKQSQIFEELFHRGCRYVVAGGNNCEQWHDVADEQFLEQFQSETEQDANFVMTSWHTDESEDDVAFFFMLNTSFGDHSFSKYLVLQVGEDPSVTERLVHAVEKWSSAPAA